MGLLICACIPNIAIWELPMFCLSGAEDQMVKTPPRFQNGCIAIPGASGIGAGLAKNAAALFPADGRGNNAAKRAFGGAAGDW